MNSPLQKPEPVFEKVETRFCPQCGSPAVTYPELIGGTAECRVCHFKASTTEFPLQFQVVSASGNVSELRERLLKDIKGVVSHHLTTPFLALLQRYGFLWWEADQWGSDKSEDGQWKRRVATIYLSNAVKALFDSMVYTREAVEVLRVQHEEYLRGK